MGGELGDETYIDVPLASSLLSPKIPRLCSVGFVDSG